MNIRIKILGDKEGKPEVSKEQFMLDWHKEFGWSKNPFKTEILKPIEDFIAGYDKDRLQINLFVIKKFKFGSIVGPPGSGKTTILKWMDYELKKYKNKVKSRLISGNKLTGEKQSIREIILPLVNPLERFITKPWQTMTIAHVTNYIKKKLENSDRVLVLLIDDIDQASDLALVLLKELFTSGIKFQLIVSGDKDDMRKKELAPFTKQDHLKIELSGMKYPDIRKMIKKRIESVGGKDIKPLSESLLKRICKEADDNPKAILGFAYNCAAEIALERWQKKKEEEEIIARERELEERELLGDESDSDEESADEDQEDHEEDEDKEEKEEKIKEKREEEQRKEKKKREEKQREKVELENYYSGDADSSSRKRRLEQEKKIEDFFETVKKNLEKE
ncbi:AAA family ATPase [Candidatus Woesearchaeota archaeon]|nr:AAA family ATPase [Candidatus Woesearchaeota archaeon]